jgi:four helix bundle protein
MAIGCTQNLPMATVGHRAESAVLSVVAEDFRRFLAGWGFAAFRGMSEQADRLKERTHAFFVRVITLCEALPDRPAPRSIADQLLASAGSVDSNYRAACRARSKREFIAKLGIVIEESDESAGWLRALQSANLADPGGLAGLLKEADELTRIFVASRKTAEMNLEREERAWQAQKRAAKTPRRAG